MKVGFLSNTGRQAATRVPRGVKGQGSSGAGDAPKGAESRDATGATCSHTAKRVRARVAGTYRGFIADATLDHMLVDLPLHGNEALTHPAADDGGTAALWGGEGGVGGGVLPQEHRRLRRAREGGEVYGAEQRTQTGPTSTGECGNTNSVLMTRKRSAIWSGHLVRGDLSTQECGAFSLNNYRAREEDRRAS